MRDYPTLHLDIH